MHGFLQNLLEVSRKLDCHATQTDECQRKSIADFQKAFEVQVLNFKWRSACLFFLNSDILAILQEQSKSDAEKLITDMTNLVSNHMRRQKELVYFLSFNLLCLTFVNFFFKLALVKLTGGCKACWSQRGCTFKQGIFRWACFLRGGHDNRCKTEMAGVFHASGE